jgi:hypothetical protein
MPTAEILQAQISLLEQQIKMLNPMMPHLGMMPMMQNPAALQQQMLMQQMHMLMMQQQAMHPHHQHGFPPPQVQHQ